MAIAKLKKLRLIGINYERQLLLNALAETNVVHVKCDEDALVAAQENEKAPAVITPETKAKESEEQKS